MYHLNITDRTHPEKWLCPFLEAKISTQGSSALRWYAVSQGALFLMFLRLVSIFLDFLNLDDDSTMILQNIGRH
jgi:hypothetical protein